MNYSASNSASLEPKDGPVLSKARVFELKRQTDYRDFLGVEKLGQKELVPKLLTGSQAKTAYALRINCQRLCEENPLESIGFFTLTVGNATADGFKQVWDAAEASRRINNLNRRFLSDIFDRYIIATERHKSGAIHFHILGVLKGLPDIRTGYDFDRVALGDYRSVSPALRRLWALCRERLPEYGFGRSELTPIKKTSSAIAGYISKYIEKNVCNRRPDDKRKKLVRYCGWEKSQMKPNEFAWAGKKAAAWRFKTRETAGLLGIQEPEQAYEAFGPRWAFHLSRTWSALGDNLAMGLCATDFEKRILKQDMLKMREAKKWWENNNDWAQFSIVTRGDAENPDPPRFYVDDEEILTISDDFWESFPGKPVEFYIHSNDELPTVILN